MTLRDDAELRDTYGIILRMYDLRDRIFADSTGDAETREDQADGVTAMIRKLERQIAEYLTRRAEEEKAGRAAPGALPDHKRALEKAA